MGSRSARLVRGAIAACFSVFVAATSHLAAGGMTPGVVGVALALAFSVPLCVLLAGRTLSLARLAVSVGFSQLALHLLFTVGAVSAAAAPGGPAGTMTMPGMSHHGSGALTELLAQASSEPAPASQPCDWMWLAHAAAALLTVLALRRGESAFWALLAVAELGVRRSVRYFSDTVALLARLQPVAPDARPAFCRIASAVHPRGVPVFLGVFRHRGPPVLLL